MKNQTQKQEEQEIGVIEREPTGVEVNAANLQRGLDWLAEIIRGRLKLVFGKIEEFHVEGIEYITGDSGLAQFLEAHHPSFQEYVILLLALTPHLQPEFFNKIISEQLPEGGDFPEFGGVKANNHRGILPTGETAQFILAGADLEKRLLVQDIFNGDHWFSQKGVMWLDRVNEGEPIMSGRLVLDPELVEKLTLGKVTKPRFSMEFPAQLIETEMDWDDLILHSKTLAQIREIENWIKHNDTLLYDWKMKKRIKPGYRALFYGPPGTGKTLTGTLLGKSTSRSVFRIDLSRMISKYIGETEKNLSKLFNKAEHKNWILFFDEADALFGKRTDIRDAHDKYANQEVAYLLQRVEAYNGLVILATNQRNNIDDAFARRFQSIIHFPIPGVEERQQLWQNAFPEQIEISKDIVWKSIASRFEIAGAGIVNIAHYCSLEILADKSHRLELKRLEAAIDREYIKDGKII